MRPTATTTAAKKAAEKKNLCVTKLKLYFQNARAVFHLIFCRCLNWKAVSAAAAPRYRTTEIAAAAEWEGEKEQRSNEVSYISCTEPYHITNPNKLRNVQVRPTVRPTNRQPIQNRTEKEDLIGWESGKVKKKQQQKREYEERVTLLCRSISVHSQCEQKIIHSGISALYFEQKSITTAIESI